MSVVVEHDGELYSLLVDAVGEVLPLSDDGLRSATRRRSNAAWREVSRGVHRLDGALLIVLSIGSLLNSGDPRRVG